MLNFSSAAISCSALVTGGPLLWAPIYQPLSLPHPPLVPLCRRVNGSNRTICPTPLTKGCEAGKGGASACFSGQIWPKLWAQGCLVNGGWEKLAPKTCSGNAHFYFCPPSSNLLNAPTPKCLLKLGSKLPTSSSGSKRQAMYVKQRRERENQRKLA
jgi:hypothetical protein